MLTWGIGMAYGVLSRFFCKDFLAFEKELIYRKKHRFDVNNFVVQIS